MRPRSSTAAATQAATSSAIAAPRRGPAYPIGGRADCQFGGFAATARCLAGAPPDPERAQSIAATVRRPARTSSRGRRRPGAGASPSRCGAASRAGRCSGPCPRWCEGRGRTRRPRRPGRACRPRRRSPSAGVWPGSRPSSTRRCCGRRSRRGAGAPAQVVGPHRVAGDVQPAERCSVRYIVVPPGERASNANAPSSVIRRTTCRSAVESTTNRVRAREPCAVRPATRSSRSPPAPARRCRRRRPRDAVAAGDRTECTVAPPARRSSLDDACRSRRARRRTAARGPATTRRRRRSPPRGCADRSRPRRAGRARETTAVPAASVGDAIPSHVHIRAAARNLTPAPICGHLRGRARQKLAAKRSRVGYMNGRLRGHGPG